MPAFVDGYHAGLYLTIALLALGVIVSYVTLRPAPAPPPPLGRAPPSPSSPSSTKKPAS